MSSPENDYRVSYKKLKQLIVNDFGFGKAVITEMVNKHVKDVVMDYLKNHFNMNTDWVRRIIREQTADFLRNHIVVKTGEITIEVVK